MCIACPASPSPPVRCATPGDVSRRTALRLFGGTAAAVALAGCDDLDLPFDLVSDAQLEQLGLQSWQQISASVPATRDAALQARAEEIAGRLLRTAGQDPRGWRVQVFASPDANAFALPGNRIGLFEGMFRVAADDHQLAAVVGHEIGHLQADHSKERVEARMLTDFGLQLVAVALDMGDVAFSREIAGILGLGAEFGIALPYGRAQELEADRIGLGLMARAGYRPEAAVALWRRMEAAGGAGPPSFLSTHPAPRERIAAIEAMLPEVAGAR